MMKLRPIVEKTQSDNSLPHYDSAYTLWNLLQDGILPYAGGWLDQPAWYTEDMDYISLLYEFESLPHILKKNAKHIDDLMNG